MPAETKLSSTTTVYDYKQMVKDKDTEGIAEFILERFTERYLTPFSDKSIKHGFSMLAISCLMIEALESFRQGWKNTNNRSKEAFKYFFDRSNQFLELRGNHQEFYKHIRCGLLHQAETTGGWKITRQGITIVDLSNKIVDATIFMRRLDLELKDYVIELKTSDFNSALWKKAITKTNHICNQCEI